MSTLAPMLVDRGHEVAVIGGEPAQMSQALRGACRFTPAASVREARRALRALGPLDVVNTHMTQADLVGLTRGRALAVARLVSTRHFSAPRGSGPARQVFRRWETRIDAELAISAYVAGSIGVPSEVVLTGVADADAGAERRDVVLLAQRLEAEKATSVALRAWAAGAARRSGWRLEIAGDGSQRPELEREATALGIRDTVDFLGHRGDVGRLMASASVLLAPTPREGLGIAVIEAMAHGLPVVAAGSGGHLETVGKVDGAALFPPGDHVAAAARVDELVGDRARRIAYGDRLQRHQRAELSLAAWADRTIGVYERAVAR